MGSVVPLGNTTDSLRDSVVRPRRLRPAWQPGRSEIDTAYWLAHCEGYRVDGAEGRIGLVEEVRLGPQHPDDTILAVRMGVLGRRVALIPASAVALVVPRAERIWLRTPATIIGSEPVPLP